ncbi:RING zinc finger-containing protein [Dictyostelium discoideum AX4]|uniref:RING zinc finger-containing protein n=1 Tax=Dictyostelium discoideum TaxID=44689 RepID=Q556N8_DICDI|nr:RING zinc finger-containing protein [Dictyostelium discoideum AX4]XP_645080.1 RING zinc finger-containing protein [Dictyostelium discoideum AX4]EAL70409.1 RING zinc finger-containing protein [Dictyostelium discoideum AX4]EAL70937.1 RING zinc finger-containing protein [Dictyostelium discoideum AX4]|eukprot:XP_644334.1 RING zinc finger-containing protein [Dictyostelium discoideum AX4]
MTNEEEQQTTNQQQQQPTPQLVINDLDSILSPIGGGGRVKYTCLDVSKRYLALGANTGSLYFFERKSMSSIIPKNKNQDNQQQLQPQLQQPQSYLLPTVKIFTNENLSFTQILSLNDIRDQISIIKINPCNDNLVAIATHKTIFIIEPNISIRREKEKVLVKMTDHPKDAEITTLIWSHCGGYLFSGDDLGNLYCCSVTKARKSFFFSADLVYKCDSKLVQLDIIPSIPTITNTQLHQDIQLTTNSNSNSNNSSLNNHHQQQQNIVHTIPITNSIPPVNSITISILASTLTKSIVVNFQILTATNVGKVLSIIQIGKKQRENTKQGACFHPFYKSSVYTSRPGKRLWLADPIDGRVLSTMNFTPSSTTNEDGTTNPIPNIILKPKPLISSNSSNDANTYLTGKFPMIFSKLLPFGNYLISYDELSLLLIDVNEVEVLEWKLDTNQIHDLVVYHDSIYALHGQNHSISRIFTSIPLEILPTPQELQEQSDQLQKQQQQQQQQQQQPEEIISEPQSQPQPIAIASLIEEKKDEQLQPKKSESQENLTTLSNSDNIIGSEIDSTNTDNSTLSSSTNSLTIEGSASLPLVSESSNQQQQQQQQQQPSSLKSSTDQFVDDKLLDSTTTTTAVETSIQRVASKECIFSDIPLSSEPLMVSTSVKDPTLAASTTRKVIKKKVIKTALPQDQQLNGTNNTATLSTSPPQSIVSSSTTATTATATSTSIGAPTEVKRTVIVKKKIIKKAAALSTTTTTTPQISSPPISNPTPSPPLYVETVSSSTTTTTTTPAEVSLSPKKEETTIAPTPTPIPTSATTVTANNIQQGIFKTLNSATSSFLEIKQFALNKTNEIKSDITHKILGPSSGDDINSSNNTNVTLNNTTTATATATTATTITDNLNTTIVNEQQSQQHPIEVLEKLTKQTYESLQQYKENKTKTTSFEPMLQIWVQLFNSIEDSVIPSDMIKDIVTSCFCFGINLKSTKECSTGGGSGSGGNGKSLTHTNKLCKCWNEQLAIEFIKEYYQFLNTNRVYLNSNERKWDRCIEQLVEFESFTKQESKIISTIYQFIDSSDSSTCLTLLDSHCSNDYGLLFRFLNQLLELDPIESSKFFAKHFPIILPRNILNFTNSLIENDDIIINKSNDSGGGSRSNKELGNLIKFEYLNQLMKLKPECKFNSLELLEQWFLSNLMNNKPNQNQLFEEREDMSTTSTRKFIPKLKSNLIEWKSKDTLIQIIDNVINNEYGNGNLLKSLESMSAENGFHIGLYKIYEHYFKNVYSMKSILHNQEQLNHYSKKLLELTIFTDDKKGFSNCFENSTSIEIWSNTLEIMKQLRIDQHENEDQSGESSITFEISELFILDLIGKAIGPLETIELVCKFSEMFEKSKIETKLLSDWIKFGKWSLYDRPKLSYDILSLLDSHLWLKKPLTISPQFLTMIGPELDPTLPNNPFKEFFNKLGTSSHDSGDNIDFKIPSFFEDNSRRHWGVETELSTGSCPICTLSLAENPESSFLGSTPATIIVFPNCGHSYHHCCIEDQGCMLCFSKR